MEREEFSGITLIFLTQASAGGKPAQVFDDEKSKLWSILTGFFLNSWPRSLQCYIFSNNQ